MRLTDAMRDTPITIPDAADITGIPKRTIYQWIAKKHLEATGPQRAKRVTIRNVYAASAAALEADTRARNLRQNR